MVKKSNEIVKSQLFATLQYFLPQHLLSRLAGFFAQSQMKGLKNTVIRWWMKRYDISLDDAVLQDIDDYKNFNDFFTRRLKKEARPLPDDPDTIICPVDGEVSQAGHISSGRIVQAKGFDFSVKELLGGSEKLEQPFQNGCFATLYLSPRDYHRVHMPCDAVLEKMLYIPGRLFSVNQMTSGQIPRLFARNERVVCVFKTAFGPMAMVLVGAMLVAGIETVWAGTVAPLRRQITEHDYSPGHSVSLNRGDEMGHFKLGSTVILLFGNQHVVWEKNCIPLSQMRLGQPIANMHDNEQIKQTV